jgi:peroxiredoxin
LGVRFYAVSVDEPADSMALRTRLTLTLPLACDVERKLTRAFGLYDAGNDIAWPAFYLLDRDGRVLFRWIEPTYPERLPVAKLLDEVNAKLSAGIGP